MSKSFLFKLVVGLCFLAVAVIWLLSALGVIAINMAWVLAIVAFALGGTFIIAGFVSKSLTYVKKFYILFGAGLIVAGVLSLIATFVEGDVGRLVLPIIAVALIAGILLGVIATGGKKWDQADNENVGYKNYWERKKEQEEKEKSDKE